tara:strand:+ start:685 stop:960 length:276 start_codon:yes stop_codon:yes gene_type:complete
MRESTIEKAVCSYAKSKGCLILKLAGMNQRGQPDRMFIRDGKSLFIEFKSPGKNPTALQIKWLLDLTTQGMNAMWCNSIADGKKLIDRIFI